MSDDFQGGYNPEDGMYYAKGSFDNENEYNNEVICLVNNVDPYLQELMNAVNEKRYNDANQIISALVEKNTENIVSLKSLGAYENDESLLNSASNYLEDISDIMKTDYKEVIDIIQTDDVSPQELSKRQERLNKRYIDSRTSLSTAFEKFMDKYSAEENFDLNVGGFNPEDGQYYPKGSFYNEAEYYNEVIHRVNFKDDYINAIAESFNTEQFERVDQLLVQFINQTTSSAEELNKLGDYNSDSDLLNASLKYLNILEGLIKNEYHQMYDIFKAKDRSMEDFQELQQIFFSKLEVADNELATALEHFIAQYDTDNLSAGSYEDNSEYQGMERKVHDESNPFLQPIHGISIQDYAAASANMANGLTEDQVAKALGVERPQWDEANQLWQARMQQDTDMTVIGLFGEYFGAAAQHPKFQNLSDDSSYETNHENLNRIKVDPEFYFDLTAAMQAAYGYGMDGAQWLRDNYGLSIGDFQSVAMQWAYSPVYMAMIPMMEEKVKEYEEKFATEQGGNVADDIEF